MTAPIIRALAQGARDNAYAAGYSDGQAYQYRRAELFADDADLGRAYDDGVYAAEREISDELEESAAAGACVAFTGHFISVRSREVHS